MTLTPDSCAFWCIMKNIFPDKLLDFSVDYYLDGFKYAMFKEMPTGMENDKKFQANILQCDLIAKYANMLNGINILEYVEDIQKF